MKEITDYYFDLQNIVDIDEDCSDNYNDNVLILFKQIIKSILKDNNDYDIVVLDSDTELFKMSGGDGTSTFPFKQFEEILDYLFQKSKFIQEKKDELYNSLFNVEQKNEPVTPTVEPATQAVEPVTPTVEPATQAVEPATQAVEPATQAVEPVTPTVEPATQAVQNVAPVVDSTNNNNNQNVIMQNQPIQVGGYKTIRKQLIKNINNIITVKLTLYNNNKFENSFIKKMRYSQ
jgi:hypothetical protein